MTCLERSQLKRIAPSAAAVLECISGVAWLTFDNDPRDFVLQAGERLSLEAGAGIIVQALEPLCYRLGGQPGASAR